MSSRASLLVGLTFLLALAGLILRSSALLSLAFPLLAYLVVAFLHQPGDLKLSGKRELEHFKVLPDTPVQSSVTVQNQGKPVDELLIYDIPPDGMKIVEGQVHTTTSLQPGEEIQITQTSRAARGEYVFGDLQVFASETFGLFQASASISAPGRLAVLPSELRMRPVPIRPPQTHGFAGPIPSRQGGAGIDFLMVREYHPGDPLRQVNWRVSARSDRDLYTTAYELQRIADVGIILDARQQIDIRADGERIFEHAVRAAGGLADLFLQDGNRVGLLVYGAAIVSAFPGLGKLQRERIQNVLARAETGFSYALERLDYIPTRFFPPRSQIILISPLVSADVPVLGYLRQQGYAVLVVSPNAILFETIRSVELTRKENLALRASLAERNLMINALRRQGVVVVDWDVSTALEPLVRMAVSSAAHRALEVIP